MKRTRGHPQGGGEQQGMRFHRNVRNLKWSGEPEREGSRASEKQGLVILLPRASITGRLMCPACCSSVLEPSVLLSAMGTFVFTAVEIFTNTELTIRFSGLLLVITEFIPAGCCCSEQAGSWEMGDKCSVAFGSSVVK